MGKTIEKAKLWNIFDRERIKRGETSPIEVEAQIDNGATVAAILPKTIAEELSLPIIRQTWGKYANELKDKKDVGGLIIEIMGRNISCDAVVEPDRKTVLIGQFALEIIDLWIDSKNGRLIPNPESPDAPMVEALLAGHPQKKTKCI